jgi:hypothetical protein
MSKNQIERLLASLYKINIKTKNISLALWHIPVDLGKCAPLSGYLGPFKKTQAISL